MKRKWVAQSRNGYTAIDYYEQAEKEVRLGTQVFPPDHWMCVRGAVAVFRTKKQAHEVESLLNAAYWEGREDERAAATI